MSARPGGTTARLAVLLTLVGAVVVCLAPVLTSSGLPGPLAASVLALVLLLAAAHRSGLSGLALPVGHVTTPPSYDAWPALATRGLDPARSPRRPRAPDAA